MGRVTGAFRHTFDGGGVLPPGWGEKCACLVVMLALIHMGAAWRLCGAFFAAVFQRDAGVGRPPKKLDFEGERYFYEFLAKGE